MECNKCGSTNIISDRSLGGRQACAICGSTDILKSPANKTKTQSLIRNPSGNYISKEKSSEEFYPSSNFEAFIYLAILLTSMSFLYGATPKIINFATSLFSNTQKHCIESTDGSKICLRKSFTNCKKSNNKEFGYECRSAGTRKSLAGVVTDFSTPIELRNHGLFGNTIFSSDYALCKSDGTSHQFLGEPFTCAAAKYFNFPGIK